MTSKYFLPISTLSLSHISFPAPPFPSPMGHSNPYGNCSYGNGAGCPRHHPFLSINPATHMILVTDPDNGCVYTLHPLQLQLDLDFDLDVQETHGRPRRPMPFAYAAFTDILALANPETECQYHLSELATNGDFTRVKTPFPKGFLPTAFVDPHLELLVTLGFISKQALSIRKPSKMRYIHGACLLARGCNAQSISTLVNPRLMSIVLSPFHKSVISRPLERPHHLPQDLGHPLTTTAISAKPSTHQTPLSSLTSSPVPTPTPTNHSHRSVQPVITKGLIIRSPNPRDKGKGKAVSMSSTEDDSMVVDSDLVNPSKGDADKDGELVDFPESPKELAEKRNA
ncbi:hypothetical protein C0995_005222 [Termitomyces sp. Mi166|nr:hypothetical protein C0995_005222 [Termitomyces sp. Mi166\